MVYFGARVAYFFALAYGPLDRVLALALLLGEGHALHHTFGYILNTWRLQTSKQTIHHVKLNSLELPSVAVLLLIKDEPPEIVKQTLVTLVSLDYANKKIYLLDGSTQLSYKRANRNLARRYHVSCYQMSRPSHSKAQTINTYLPRLEEKYLAIFDADQNPLSQFLTETVGIIETDKALAFVQTPQLYTNIEVSPIAKNAALQQSIFYESICEAKGRDNAMFCCGTNVLLRTDVLKEVHGFNEKSVTEDFSTSVDIHALGYRSVYLNRVLVFGLAPETLPAYLKQQMRWAVGTTGVLHKLFWRLLHAPRSLSLAQWWEYSLSSTYYLVGWAFFLLMICPILFLLFHVPSYFMQPQIYLMTFLPYYVMSTLLFYSTMKKRHYSPSSIVNGILMSSICFPVFLTGSFYGLFNRKMDFVVTPKGQGGGLSFWQLWPWNTMILLNLFAVVVGAFNLHDLFWPIFVNMLWCLYHIGILSNIYRLNQQPYLAKRSVYAH